MRWLSLVLWIALCQGVGLIGARWTASEIPAWYRTLRRPSFSPPNWVFAPVWTTLYLLMAIAAWLVGQAPPSTGRTVALVLFLVQLALNLAWTWLFFRKHAIGAALVELVVLWIFIGATALCFHSISPIAGWLMIPYWLWVSFATLLNSQIRRLN